MLIADLSESGVADCSQGANEMPDVADVKPAALWYGVVLDDLDGFSNSFGMPVWNPYGIDVMRLL